MLQELDENGSIRRDVAVLLQHEPVFTLGTGSTESNLLFDPAASSIPLFRTERGGEVTYHGPGQLVLYPLLHLTQHQQDLHWYLRALEDVVIRALDQVSGLQGERLPGLTGVWVQGKKVAAIGVRAKRWVTYHGLALNVCPDLTPFKQIIPCGITDRPVTSVAELLLLGEEADGQAGEGGSKYGQQGGSLACMRVAEEVALLEEYREALLEAFSHVFNVELSFADDARSSSV
ncbi:lipoate-protein ligase B [Haematococcus lacustris]